MDRLLLTAGPARAPGLIVTDALTERFGAFIIIVLGETLTAVVAGLSGRPVSWLTLAVGLVAIVVGFGAWWTYFDFAGNHHPGTGRAARVRWILGHLPLTAAVAAMGTAMLSLVEHAPLLLALGLVFLLSIPWGYAVARRLANGTDSPTQSS